MDLEHDWTYVDTDNDIDTYGTVMGYDYNDCVERIITVLEIQEDAPIDKEHLSVEGFDG